MFTSWSLQGLGVKVWPFWPAWQSNCPSWVMGCLCVSGGQRTPEEAASKSGRAALQQGHLAVPQPQRCSLWAAPHTPGEGGLCRVYYGRWAVPHSQWCCQQYFSIFKCEDETEAGQLAVAYSDAKYYVSKGQSSSAAKMKSLTGAMEIMTETRHAFQLICNELLEEQVKIHFGTMDCSALFHLFMYRGFAQISSLLYTVSSRSGNQTPLNQQNLAMSLLPPPLDWISRKWWS